MKYNLVVTVKRNEEGKRERIRYNDVEFPDFSPMDRFVIITDKRNDTSTILSSDIIETIDVTPIEEEAEETVSALPSVFVPDETEIELDEETTKTH